MCSGRTGRSRRRAAFTSSSVADRYAGGADLAVDVGPLLGIEAVQGDRVERGGQARHAAFSAASRWKRRLVRKGSPSPANIRVGRSPDRLWGNTPAVNGNTPGRFSLRRYRTRAPDSVSRGTAVLGSGVPDRVATVSGCGCSCQASSNSVTLCGRLGAQVVQRAGILQQGSDGLHVIVPADGLDQVRGLGVVAADGLCDLSQVALPPARNDRRRRPPVGRAVPPAGRACRDPTAGRARRDPRRLELLNQPVEQHVHAFIVNREATVPPGLVLPAFPERSAVADELASHIAQRVLGAAPDRTC